MFFLGYLLMFVFSWRSMVISQSVSLLVDWGTSPRRSVDCKHALRRDDEAHIAREQRNAGKPRTFIVDHISICSAGPVTPMPLALVTLAETAVPLFRPLPTKLQRIKS